MTDLPPGSFQPQPCSPDLENMLRRSKFSKEINFRELQRQMYGARYDDSSQLHHPSTQSRLQGSRLSHRQHSRLPLSGDSRPVPQALSRLLSPPGHQLPAKGTALVPCHTPGGPGANRWAATEPASKPLHGWLQYVLETRVLTIYSSLPLH